MMLATIRDNTRQVKMRLGALIFPSNLAVVPEIILITARKIEKVTTTENKSEIRYAVSVSISGFGLSPKAQLRKKTKVVGTIETTRVPNKMFLIV